MAERGPCRCCGLDVALRANGTVRAHGWTGSSSAWCRGTGMEPDTLWRAVVTVLSPLLCDVPAVAYA